MRRGATTLELLLLCTPRRRIHSGCARRWLALALALDTAQRRTALAVPRSLARSLARRQLARCAAHLPSSKLDAYRAHCAGGPGVIKLVLQGSEYKIDLWRMLQVNAKTGFERQLSRQGPAVPKITAAAPLAASVPRSPAATTTQPLPLSAVRIPDHLPLPSCLRPAALLSAPAQCVAHGYTDKHTRVSTPETRRGRVGLSVVGHRAVGVCTRPRRRAYRRCF